MFSEQHNVDKQKETDGSPHAKRDDVLVPKDKKLVEDEENELTEDEVEEEEDMEQEQAIDSVMKKKRLSLGEGSGKSGSKGAGGGGGEVAQRVCLVQNCGADLSGCKKYHQRHRVCEVHAKSPVVLVDGLRQRFCQQCSRFHELSEFDQTKRSCRRRLAGHNERRRKSSLDSQREGSGPSQRLKEN